MRGYEERELAGDRAVREALGGVKDVERILARVATNRANARDLPWRHPDTSPWAILLSEVMSQQTPVARVAPVTPAEIARLLRPWLGGDAGDAEAQGDPRGEAG